MNLPELNSRSLECFWKVDEDEERAVFQTLRRTRPPALDSVGLMRRPETRTRASAAYTTCPCSEAPGSY